jgi:hypothetical protein
MRAREQISEREQRPDTWTKERRAVGGDQCADGRAHVKVVSVCESRVGEGKQSAEHKRMETHKKTRTI